MKTVVVYYSFTGKTEQAAQKIAKQENAVLVAVKEKQKRNKFSAYVFGSLQARRQKQVELAPFACDFSAYDKIIIAMPIWAGYPAPAFNTIAAMLPKGKQVALMMTSATGRSAGSAESSKAMITAQGCTIADYTDIS